MSNQQGRRHSKRLAAAVDLERDDDFRFSRKSKRPKTEESPGSTTQRGQTAIEPGVNERTTIKTISTSGRISLSTSTAPGARKSSRWEGNDDAQEVEAALTTGKALRKSLRGAAAQKENRGEGSGLNDASSKATSPSREKLSKRVRRWEPSPTPRRPTESKKSALPISDTPIINRNKDMRKKGRKGNRRSSLGSRGRRASSLIESGQTAIPQRDVNPAEFYKHIETEGLIEPKRMMQLLMWCGERALPAKPPYGPPNANAILGARAIQDQILKDFAQRSEFFNWFSRDENAPKQPAILKPNPRNIELVENLTTLKAKIWKLQEEKQAWLSIRQPPPDIPPIFSPNETLKIELPNFNLLEPGEVKIRHYLADDLTTFANVRFQTEKRIRKIQMSLEFEVDHLAYNVHKLEQRVLVAARQAGIVLNLSAQRLGDREQRARRAQGQAICP